MFKKILNLFKYYKPVLPSYEKNHYMLEDAEILHIEYPDTFEIPEKKLRQNLQTNTIVKLIFKMESKMNNTLETERMWVKIIAKEKGFYIGILDNDPYADAYLESGQTIYFQDRHIIDVYKD